MASGRFVFRPQRNQAAAAEGDAMRDTILNLVHFRDLDVLDTPNTAAHDAKGIGWYWTEEEATRGLQRVADQPGFRDHPDGFRLIAIPLDRTFWSEGFEPNGDGTDRAVAGDPSPLNGNDAGLRFIDEEDPDNWRDVEADRKSLLEGLGQPGGILWWLYHYKVSERSGQEFDDTGEKLVGVYRSLAALQEATNALRDKPGFADWPGGFRPFWGATGGEHWLEGFASSDDDHD